MMFNLTGGGFIPDGALIGVGEALLSLWRLVVPAAAEPGVPLARAVANGLLKPTGKLFQVLSGMEKGYAAASPKSAFDALAVVQKATSAAGLDVGVATVEKGGAIVLQNVGGIATTLGTDGSILVQRGADVLLHLIP
jgi:hypothetical protein